MLSRSKWQLSKLFNRQLKKTPPNIAECAFALIERLTIDEFAEEINLKVLKFDNNDTNLLK